MAISHALQPLLLLLLALFFLPAALGLGTFVNFTNCRVSYPYRRVNVTSIWIDPYPLPLREINRIKITAETNYNITLGKMILNTFSVPLVLNPVHDEFHLCRDHTVTTCPVTAVPMVINIPVVINGADHYVREYFAEILLIEELINQTMCVTFRYLVRDPEFSTGILAA